MEQSGQRSDEVCLEHRASPGMVLRTAHDGYRILDIGADSCLVEAPRGGVTRGYADIYQGERQVERCLIVLTETEGSMQRCTFKQRTVARATPPADFAV